MRGRWIVGSSTELDCFASEALRLFVVALVCEEVCANTTYAHLRLGVIVQTPAGGELYGRRGFVAPPLFVERIGKQWGNACEVAPVSPPLEDFAGARARALQLAGHRQAARSHLFP